MSGKTLGTGVLTWDRSERVSDRYGYVYLMTAGANSQNNVGTAVPLASAPIAGSRGRLLAEVLEARESTHIGDLFHGVFPTTPNVGEVITLGEGELVIKPSYAGYDSVGIRPDDGRDNLWLDIRALYRCHEQTVRLIFQEEK